MDHYVGLDVSLKETHFCMLDGTGGVAARGREATHPELLALAPSRHAPETPRWEVLPIERPMIQT